MPSGSVAHLCVAGTLRRATRSVSRLYDAHLAHAGLTTTQYSLLVSLARHGEPMQLADLALQQTFERTSLYRALEPLRREKLVAISAGPGRRKLVALTSRGERRVEEAQPHWQAAQDAVLEEFGRTAWRGLAQQLIGLVDAVPVTWGVRS